LALGVFPVVSLSEARALTLDAKKLLQQNIEPSVHKRREKSETSEHTFKLSAEKWHKKESGLRSKNHSDRARRMLKIAPIYGYQDHIQYFLYNEINNNIPLNAW